MIARIFGGVALGLAMLCIAQTVNLANSERELRAVTANLEAAQFKMRDQQRQIDTSETARQSEREQCAADFAGEVERAKIEVAKASKAAVARSQITGICPRATTPAERLAALRANSGDSK